MWSFGLLLGIGHAFRRANEASCIINTGKRCDSTAAKCGQNAECIGGLCVCMEGTCSGADALCYANNYSYEKIGDGQAYKLCNSRWPSFCMYGTAGGQLGVTDDHDKEESKFTLLSPPNMGPNGEKYYLVYSNKWQEYNIHVKQQTSKSSNNRRRRPRSEPCPTQWHDEPQWHNGQRWQHGSQWYDEEEYDEFRRRCLEGRRRRRRSTPSVRNTTNYVVGFDSITARENTLGENALLLTRAPVDSPVENRSLVMLSGVAHNYYLYTPSGSWSVKTWKEDPGAGGYWFFDPPLTEEMQSSLMKFTGNRCSSDCGEALISGLALILGSINMWTIFFTSMIASCRS